KAHPTRAPPSPSAKATPSAAARCRRCLQSSTPRRGRSKVRSQAPVERRREDVAGQLAHAAPGRGVLAHAIRVALEIPGADVVLRFVAIRDRRLAIAGALEALARPAAEVFVAIVDERVREAAFADVEIAVAIVLAIAPEQEVAALLKRARADARAKEQNEAE